MVENCVCDTQDVNEGQVW